jgi:hypothetical protein
MPRASSGTLVDSVNIATAWFPFCRAEAFRDTAGEQLAAVQTQKGPRVPRGLSKGRLTRRSESYADAGPEGPSCQRTDKERASAMPTQRRLATRRAAMRIGRVSEGDLAAVREAGFTEAELVEIVAYISLSSTGRGRCLPSRTRCWNLAVTC